MNRFIVILRHAQSAGKQAGQSDYQRTLTEEGERAAKALGIFLTNQSVKPDYLLSSSAVRARSTAEGVNESMQIAPSHICYLDDLYEATPDTWLNEIRIIPDEHRALLLVGHNPAISQLATAFGGRTIDLAPAGHFSIQLQLDSWKDLRLEIV